MKLKLKLMRHSSIPKGKLNKFPSRSQPKALIPLCHAPRPTPRAWRSFHTSNPKAYSVTWPKQLSCNWNLPITKYLFRVAEQNLKSSKFNFKTKTSTIQKSIVQIFANLNNSSTRTNFKISKTQLWSNIKFEGSISK